MSFVLAFLLFAIVAGSLPVPVQRPAPARIVTACAAVTRADIEQALGRFVAAGKEESGRSESTCDYAGTTGQVTISIHRATAKLDVPSEIENLKAALPGTIVRTVQGIGTQAFFLDLPGAGTQLHIIRGERDYVLVSVLGFGEAPQVSAAVETLARKALERL